PLPVVNGRSANIGPKLLLRLTGTCSVSSNIQVKPPADVPVGNVVVSPSIQPYSALLEFSVSAPVVPASSRNKIALSAPPALRAPALSALCAPAPAATRRIPTVKLAKRAVIVAPSPRNATSAEGEHNSVWIG